MTWRIDEIDFMTFPGHADGGQFDSDSTLLFDFHSIEHLAVFHFAFFLGSCEFEHPICKGRLAVVDMGDDSEIPDGHACILAKRRELQSLVWLDYSIKFIKL